MYRLITKKDRQEMRKAWTEGQTTEAYKDIEILTKDTPCISLSIWRGTAGRPYLNFSYRTIEQRDQAIIREKGAALRREKYKKKNADNRGKVLTQSAQASRTIKSILKKEYPNIKFSVKSSNYANGSSVDVCWFDGVPEKELDAFLNQFQQGHFDGMIDLYEYSNTKNMPQAKFVFGKRTVSKEKQEIIKKQLAELMNIENSDYAVIPKDFMVNVRGYAYECPLSALVYQIAVNFDFSKGFTGVQCKKAENGEDIINMFELY